MNNPRYFYKVEEFVTTFGADPGNTEGISNTKEFRPEDYDNSLMKTRIAADMYYNERETGMEETSFFMPFAGPQEFNMGENAAYSLTLYLVEHTPSYHTKTFGWVNDEVIEYPVRGEDFEEMEAGLEIESELLNQDYGW